MAIDGKAYLSGWLVALVDMVSKDIRAMSDDQWTATHGGVSKSASGCIADALGMLKWTSVRLGGVEAPMEETYMNSDMLAAVATRDGAMSALQTTSEEFNAALAAASDDDLNATIIPPWQMPAPLFMIAQIAVSHLWYHDGQVNYIQTLNGDKEVHWMDQ